MGRDVSTKVNKNSKSSGEPTPPASDASYSEKAAYNLQCQGKAITDSLNSSIERQQSIQNHPEASPSDKAAATVLAGAEMAMSMAATLWVSACAYSESLMFI